MPGDVTDLIFTANDRMRRMLDDVNHAVAHREPVVQPPAVSELIETLRNVCPENPSGKPLNAPVSSNTAVFEPVAIFPTPEAPVAAPIPTPNAAPTDNQGSTSNREVPAKKAPSRKLAQNIKVDVGRVDAMVELIGELMVAHSLVSGSFDDGQTTDRTEVYLSQLEKTIRDLQRHGLALRMTPLRRTFSKMSRIIRDVSRKVGKRVEVRLAGENTEMDRNLVEQVSDPLVHMVRNAVDHGLESPDERVAAGKPSVGNITLSARTEGGKISISVRDDGRGLDRERIFAKAVQRGLVDKDEKLTDDEVYNLLFEAGFSTAEQVTDISGRGVGMDVVRRSIESQRGRIRIESELGVGTTFTMVLPLTLAIIDGVLIDCAGQQFILPAYSMFEVLPMDSEMRLEYAGAQQFARIRGELMPLVRLEDLLELDREDGEASLLVIIEDIFGRFALVVDDVLNQQHVVIKNIDSGLFETEVFAGAAVLSTGMVGLILNIDALGEEVRQRTKRLNQMTGSLS